MWQTWRAPVPLDDQALPVEGEPLADTILLCLCTMISIRHTILILARCSNISMWFVNHNELIVLEYVFWRYGAATQPTSVITSSLCVYIQTVVMIYLFSIAVFACHWINNFTKLYQFLLLSIFIIHLSYDLHIYTLLTTLFLKIAFVQ